MTERKLATIRRISNIEPIEGADAIEVATVDGWKVVVKKNEFEVGQLVTYIEIDSWVPHDIAPFLSKGKEPREFNGVKGERLRTVKLRGQISQGLIIPQVSKNTCEGADVTEFLGIQKWEKPIPPQLAGQVKGNFPSFIPKTDQERVQNLVAEIEKHRQLGTVFEVTEKLDGSSMTVFLNEGEFGVCSRNLQLKIEGNENNAFVKTAISLGLEEKLKQMDVGNVALQGELIGEGIQGNPYKLQGLHYYVYNVYSIDEQGYFYPRFAKYLCNDHDINYVPSLESGVSIDCGVDDLLSIADGMSVLNKNTRREGLVFKSEDNTFSFKTISNQWLLKGGE